MILDRIKTGICRIMCLRSACSSDPKIEQRLNRAEALHVISSRAAKKETAVVKKRVGDMRVVANSAVRRLRHERGESEEAEA